MSGLQLKTRYGGYALITGAARGIGRAFAVALAEERLDLLLVDKLEDESAALAAELAAKYGIQAVPLACDLMHDDVLAASNEWVTTYDIGMLISNAGISPMGKFLEMPLQVHLDTARLNCHATLVLSHVIGKHLVARGRGAIVITSSQSAVIGAPYFSSYAATKSYGLNLAFGLWDELRRDGVDVLGLCPGLTNTTPVRELRLDTQSAAVVPLNEPHVVATGALRALGQQPYVIPTWVDRVFAFIMSRLLPRRWALAMVGASMRKTMDAPDP